MSPKEVFAHFRGKRVSDSQMTSLQRAEAAKHQVDDDPLLIRWRVTVEDVKRRNDEFGILEDVKSQNDGFEIHGKVFERGFIFSDDFPIAVHLTADQRELALRLKCGDTVVVTGKCHVYFNNSTSGWARHWLIVEEARIEK
jgi:hypothetical protein